MITPRIKPSSFFPEEAADDLFVVQQRKAKLEGYVQTLAAMDKLIDFAGMAAAVDKACPRADRSKGGRPPYPTEALVRMVFLQGLYNLSDEQCEHQVLDRLSFQRFCRLDGVLNIPDARTLWNFRQRLATGGLGGRAIFESLSQQLQQHGFIPRGGQIVDASIVQAFDYANNVREAHAHLSAAAAMYRRTFNAGWNSGASWHIRDAQRIAAKDCRKCFPEEVADGGHTLRLTGDGWVYLQGAYHSFAAPPEPVAVWPVAGEGVTGDLRGDV